MMRKYYDIIDKLTISNANFAQMLHEHETLNLKINRLSQDNIKKLHEIQNLKSKKLELKDKLYKIMENALNEQDQLIS